MVDGIPGLIVEVVLLNGVWVTGEMETEGKYDRRIRRKKHTKELYLVQNEMFNSFSITGGIRQ